MSVAMVSTGLMAVRLISSEPEAELFEGESHLKCFNVLTYSIIVSI